MAYHGLIMAHHGLIMAHQLSTTARFTKRLGCWLSPSAEASSHRFLENYGIIILSIATPNHDTETYVTKKTTKTCLISKMIQMVNHMSMFFHSLRFGQIFTRSPVTWFGCRWCRCATAKSQTFQVPKSKHHWTWLGRQQMLVIFDGNIIII